VCCVRVSATWTVRRLKKEVQSLEGTPAPRQCLLVGPDPTFGTTDCGPLADHVRVWDCVACLSEFGKDTLPDLVLVRLPADEQWSEKTSTRGPTLTVLPSGFFSAAPEGADEVASGRIIQWVVDNQIAQRNIATLLSPTFELNLLQSAGSASFKLGILPRAAGTFRKSQGEGVLHLKCLSTLTTVTSLSFRCIVMLDSNSHAPPILDVRVEHDFARSALWAQPIQVPFINSQEGLTVCIELDNVRGRNQYYHSAAI